MAARIALLHDSAGEVERQRSCPSQTLQLARLQVGRVKGLTEFRARCRHLIRSSVNHDHDWLRRPKRQQLSSGVDLSVGSRYRSDRCGLRRRQDTLLIRSHSRYQRFASSVGPRSYNKASQRPSQLALLLDVRQVTITHTVTMMFTLLWPTESAPTLSLEHTQAQLSAFSPSGDSRLHTAPAFSHACGYALSQRATPSWGEGRACHRWGAAACFRP